MTRIFKFGGASIHDAAAIRQLGELLAGVSDRPLVMVLSAMGKTTDALEGLLDAARQGDESDYAARLGSLRDAHLGIVDELFGAHSEAGQRIEALLAELDRRHRRHCRTDRAFHYDQTVGFGELLSTTLVAAWLNERGIATDWRDARELIVTDASHQAANVDWRATAQRVCGLDLASGRLQLTQGFLGATVEGVPTTLGREGSDYSAAILAHCLDAEEVVVWKDVPGLYNADPRRVDNAVQLEHLSYGEVTELAWYGAKVIHPKTLAPLQAKGIPLTVRSFETPTASPTTIDHDSRFDADVPALVLLEQQVGIELRPRDLTFMDEARLHDILGRLVEEKVHANLLDAGALHLTLSLDARQERLEPLIASLADDYALDRQNALTLLTVRHPNDALLTALRADREILAERRSLDTAQCLLRSRDCPEVWHVPT